MNKDWILHWKNKFLVRLSNYGLLAVIFFTLFLFPLFSAFFAVRIFDLCLTLVILISVYATSESVKFSGGLQVAVAIGAIWITRIADITYLNYLSKMILIVFFMIRVSRFIRQISRKKTVTSLVIIEAINGYLLLGVAFGILIGAIINANPNAFSYALTGGTLHFYDPYYYAFVTMTTVGYGDFLPLIPAAKAIAVFIALCGQIYLVTIMAFLIGRLLSQRVEDNY